MAISNVIKTRRDGQITIKDSGGSNSIVVDYEGDGNFSFDNGAEQAERTTIMDRGAIVGLRKANDVVGSLSFSVNYREWTNSTVENLIDCLNKTGGASSWVSTGGTGFEHYLLDVVITVEGTAHGDGADHSATFTKCLLTWDWSEGDVDTINISGEVYGGIAYTGV